MPTNPVIKCLICGKKFIRSKSNRKYCCSECAEIGKRKAIEKSNKKLIERQLLIETNIYKDSIILDYKQYIEEQNKINKEFQHRINKANELNQDLSKRLNRQQKTSLVLGSIAGASIVVIIITALIN